MTDDTVQAREISITRVYHAQREEVWKAWTEPERLATWWGKRGWNAVPSSITMEVRPGGAFRVTSISAKDGAEQTTAGVYREVVAPERLVLEESSEDAWHTGAVSTVVLIDLGDGHTEMRFDATVHTTGRAFEAARAGMGSAFDRLAEHLDPKEPA